MDDPYLSVFLLLMDNQYYGAVDYLIVNVNIYIKKKTNICIHVVVGMSIT